MSGTAADVLRNPEKLPRDDVAFIEAMTHEPVGNPGGGGLWHHKGMQLPAYIQHIANDLRSERGMTESRAISTAVSRCKAWCAGGGGVKADTKAKACAAVAEWEALKVKSHLARSLRASAGLPDLVTIPGVDLLAAGTWELSSGRNTFTRADIANAIEAAQCPAVRAPVIKLGHQDPRFNDPTHDGEPAIGRVVNMRADATGSKLIGDLADMPGWLGGIAANAYPSRSVEGSYGFRCQIGHTHPFVLTGLALLGVTAPGVGVLNGLPDIASLYGIEAAAVERQFITAPQDMEGAVVAVTEEDVRRAYYANSGAPSSWWISELQMVPTQLVVAGEDGKIYRVPFEIEGDEGTITFGTAEPIPDYAALSATRGTGRLVTYASADESRNVGAADNGWTQRDGKWVYDPDNDGDDDSTASGDTDHSHWDANGKQKKPVPPKPTNAGASDPPTLEGDNKTGNVNNASMSAETHGSYSGTHSHPHAANGAQGSDDTHSHSHTHNGDGDHGHAHANATGADKDGGSDVEFTKEQETNLRAALGLGEDDELTPEAVLTASAALHEQAEAKVTAAKRGKLPEGVIAVEQEVWDNINRKVEAGERFRSKVLRDERDEVIDSAVRAGKFSAARAPHWKRLWDADPEGTREVLGSLKKNSVPVDDLGAGGGNLDDEAYEQEYAALYPPGEFAKG